MRGELPFLLRRLLYLLSCAVVFFLVPGVCPADDSADDYGFDLDEFEKKNYDWGGYGEVKWDHSRIHQDAAFTRLILADEKRSSLDRFSSLLQLDGNLQKGIVDFNLRLQAMARQDQLHWYDRADIFEGFVSIKPSPSATVDLGKKVFKWGKGYAWNPVAFIDRPKDSTNPEDALEGFVGVGLDLIKSFSGPLQTAALTTVLLPVWQGVNEDFGEMNKMNLAGKLYLLYRNIDIDLIWFTGNSRSTRYGIDFSTNLATNFEIHGELAHVRHRKTMILAPDGSIMARERPDTSYLLGLRYLSESEITTIVEFYHNDHGYSSSELDCFFQLVEDGGTNDVLFNKATHLSQSGYGNPQVGRNYLYTKVTWKEPFDLLYFAPGFSSIVNLDDMSYSFIPEAVYSGWTNWEMRLRFSVINGGSFTEYGEKMNSNKLELRLRYFF